MYKLSIVLLTLATFCYGYDFKDSIFNEYLFEELKDTVLSEPQFRFKRNAPQVQHGQYRGAGCCKSDKVNPANVELMKNIKTECHKEIGDLNFVIDPFDCESAKKLKQNLICMTECSAKKWNVVNDNGELDRNKMIEKLKSSFTEEQWKLEKTEEIVDKCLVEAKEKLTNEKNECSQEALTMLHCIWKEFNQYCPKDLQVDSVKCNKLREKITKNDEAYLRLAHFHQLIHMYQKEE